MPNITEEQTPQEFTKDIQKFWQRNEGWTVMWPELWHKRVSSTHQSIRRFLKGASVQDFLTITSNQSNANDTKVDQIANQIIKIAPGYLSQYSFDKSVFNYPTIQVGTHNSIKVGKHLLSYANGCIGRRGRDELNKLVSKLGQCWSKNKTSDDELEITLSTRSKAFYLLGHYGPDQESCFRQCSDKPQHKYVLGQTPDTFVITISKFSAKRDRHINVFRCFGFTTDNHTRFHICNSYLAATLSEGNAIEAIRQLLSNITKKKMVFNENENILLDGSVYQNGYGKWSFSEEQSTNVARMSANDNYIYRFICKRCGREHRDSHGWQIVDERPVCNSCTQRANKCEFSLELTFKKLVKVLGRDGVHMYAKEDMIDKHCEQCGDCEDWCVPHSLIDSRVVCSDCIDEYVSCDITGTALKDSKAHNVGPYSFDSDVSTKDIMEYLINDIAEEV